MTSKVPAATASRARPGKSAAEPPPGKGDRRRLEILEAARRVLVEEGYDRFVVREIAAGLGVTLGNLQYYFATHDDLLEAVVRAEFERNQAEVEARIAALRSPRERLAAVAKHLIDVWAKEGGRVYAVMSLLALHQPRFTKLHREIYESFYEALLPLLAELRPRAARAELLRLARLLTTLLDGALVQVPNRAFVGDVVATVVALAEKKGPGTAV